MIMTEKARRTVMSLLFSNPEVVRVFDKVDFHILISHDQICLEG